MSEVILPGEDSDDTPSYEDVVAALPLENCQLTKNALFALYEAENETEYIAPVGQAFMLTGSFVAQPEASDFDREYAQPAESRGYFMNKHKEEIKKYQAPGMSVAQAFELFMTDYFDTDCISARDPFIPPEVFIGRTLAIRSNSLQIVVKGPVEAGAEAGIRVIKLPTGNGSERSTGISVPGVNIWWQREIAIGIFGECKVELVPHDEPKPELWLPKERKEGLFVAGSSSPYSDLTDEFGELGGAWVAAMTESRIREEELFPERAAQKANSPF